MANQITAPETPAADAAIALVINSEYNIIPTGFTYVRDFAVIRGKLQETGESVGIIIGEKALFPMSEMFQMKQANNVVARYKKDVVVNGVVYKNFQLVELSF